PNALGERAQRFLGEGNLHGRQVEAPELAGAAFGEVAQRVAAAATEFEGAEVGGELEQSECVFGRRERAILGQRSPAVEDGRNTIPPRAVDRERGTQRRRPP